MPIRTAARAVVAALLAAPTAPQEPWRLPPLGAAEYRRETRARSVAAATPAQARDATPNEAVPDAYLAKLVPAPWLCQGELQPDQRALATPVRDLRDLLRAVALDLSVRGSGSWRLPRVVPFGDIAVTGRVSGIGADGAQTMELTLDRRPAQPRTGEDRRARDDLAALCDRDLGGQLTVHRRVDAAAGLVREFTAELSIVVAEDKRRHRRIDVRDEWHLVAVRENQDADFRARVAAAVRAGAAWIRSSLEGLDAAWLLDREDHRSYGSGRIALAALTLLHAEVPAQDPVLTAAFAVLRRRKLVDTYSLATAMMAVAQRYAPPREAEMIRLGTLTTRAVRELADDDRKLAARWLERLLGNRDTRVAADELLRFDYDGGGRYDNSLSQYGLLGLDAAALCGLEIAPSTWLAAARHFLGAQCPASGRAFDLDLTTHRELALAGADAPPRHPQRATPRGFAYQGEDEAPYGSMTAASIAGLVVARAGAVRAGTATQAQIAAIDQAIANGFAWLASEFTLRANPGFVGKADRHWYYWLYCLERACELAGIARLQGRDWYYEGALQLMAQQQSNGSFRPDRGDALLLESTCFAVLFLKKATLPALTGATTGR